MPSGSADPTSLVRTAVLDTSVLLRWAHDHADAEQPAADRLREAWTRGRATFLMLDLSVYELVNVLARRLGRTSAEIQSTVRWLFGLQLPFVRVAERTRSTRLSSRPSTASPGTTPHSSRSRGTPGCR